MLEGKFVNGIPEGHLIQTYPNGDIRDGHFNRTWIGKVLFYEKGNHDNTWHEKWNNGNYKTQVEISKSVVNEYQDITVEIICKVHSTEAVPELFKEGIQVAKPMDRHSMPNQEVSTIRLKLDFSDDPFKQYTCRARKGQRVLASQSMKIRNPFFLVSHGNCGAQLALNEIPSRKKRSPVSGIKFDDNKGSGWKN